MLTECDWWLFVPPCGWVRLHRNPASISKSRAQTAEGLSSWYHLRCCVFCYSNWIWPIGLLPPPPSFSLPFSVVFADLGCSYSKGLLIWWVSTKCQRSFSLPWDLFWDRHWVEKQWGIRKKQWKKGDRFREPLQYVGVKGVSRWQLL